MIDKSALRKRLEAMLTLPSDWDGFGTEPLNQRVFDISSELLNHVPDSILGLKIFVGVNNEGSLYLEFDLNRKIIEMTILDNGTIHYDEIVSGTQIGSGSFYMSESAIKELLEN